MKGEKYAMHYRSFFLRVEVQILGLGLGFFLIKKPFGNIRNKSNQNQNIAQIEKKMEIVIRRCPKVPPTHNKTKKKSTISTA
jgi:hypothetical protein